MQSFAVFIFNLWFFTANSMAGCSEYTGLLGLDLKVVGARGNERGDKKGGRVSLSYLS